MRFYVIESHALVIGWSPKCACTAATDWIVNGILRPQTPVKKEMAYLIQEGFALQESAKATSLIFDKGFKPVIFTRDPAARIVSAYINKFICRNGRPLRYPKKFEQFAITFINRLYKQNNYEGVYKGITFVEFLNYIDFCMSKQKKINHHWTPQVSGLTSEFMELIASNQCLVVRQESFEHDLKNINTTLGFNYIPGPRNVSLWPKGWPLASQNQDYSTMTNKALIRRKIQITKANLLTDDTKSIIHRIYRDDFKLLGLSLA